MNLSTLSVAQKKALRTYLDTYLTENRKRRFEEVIQFRTRHFTVVLEDIYMERNAGAIIRTADCYGIQDVHIIETKYQPKVTHTIARGAEKWLTPRVYHQPEEDVKTCIADLKAKGYRIVATSPHERSKTIHNLDIAPKTAFILGAEKKGVSQEALELTDEFVTIPIYGFSESYNVSVANALLFHELTARLRKSNISWQLKPEEQLDLWLLWSLQTIISGERIAQMFLSELDNSRM